MTAAPAWAYLTSAADVNGDGAAELIVKAPDGTPGAGIVKAFGAPDFATNLLEGAPILFGGNDEVMFAGRFTSNTGAHDISIKGPDGAWRIASSPAYAALDEPAPAGVFGGIGCHPVAADFDGDGLDDRAVMCPDEWRIAYSGAAYSALMSNGVRHVPLGYDPQKSTLPGRAYAGNISFAATQQLIDVFKHLSPTTPPLIPVDMVSIATCAMANGC